MAASIVACFYCFQALASTLPASQRLQRLSYNQGSLLFTSQPMANEVLHDAQGKLDALGLNLQHDQNNQFTLSTKGVR